MIIGRVKRETHPGIPPADEAGYGAGHPDHRHITGGPEQQYPKASHKSIIHTTARHNQPTAAGPGASAPSLHSRQRRRDDAPTPDQMKPPSQKRPPCFSQKTTLNCGWAGAGAGGPPKFLKKFENAKKILILTGIDSDHRTGKKGNPSGYPTRRRGGLRGRAPGPPPHHRRPGTAIPQGFPQVNHPYHGAA